MTKKKPVVRKGELSREMSGPLVKTYLIELSDKDIKRTNTGFNGWELYGLLRMVLLDLEAQLAFSTSWVPKAKSTETEI